MNGAPNLKLAPDRHCRNRLVACQGSIQLVTAIAASTHKSASVEKPVRNWLVIHDLYAPPGQELEFVDCLRRLASAMGAWEGVIHLSTDQVQTLTSLTRRKGHTKAIAQLQEWLCLPEIHEMYLSQHRVLVNDLFGQLFPLAAKYCYGDAIGVNFSPQYFVGTQSQSLGRSLQRQIAHSLRTLVRRVTRHSGDPPQVKFDRHYLMLPNLFDEVLATYEQLDPSRVMELFARIESTVRPDLARVTSEWDSDLRSADRVVVLLTSNFSEAGRMPEDREIEAYLSLVDAECKVTSQRRAAEPKHWSALKSHPTVASPVILLKPHPRDSSEKIRRLREALQRTGAKVFVLSDPLSFYLPFEVILHSMLLRDRQLAQRLSVVCVSSACLSLELLYDVRCRIGFGEKIVREHFSESWKELRLRHEHDLQSAMQTIRRLTADQAA